MASTKIKGSMIDGTVDVDLIGIATEGDTLTELAADDKLVAADISDSNNNVGITTENLFKSFKNLTEVTTSDAADLLPIYDSSGTSVGFITLTNLLEAINTLTVDNTPDTAADYLITYDTSAGTVKRVLAEDVGGASAAAETWVRKTANYTAVSGDKILADTVATAAFTITLPATPSGGDNVTIVPSSSYATNNLTIGRNSETIMGDGANLILSTTHAIKLIYDGTDSDWRVM